MTNTQKKEKRLLRHLINSFLLVCCLLIIGCEQNATECFSGDITIFNEVIKNDLQIFKNYDSVNYATNEYYIKSKKICDLADLLVESIKGNNISSDSIVLFNNYLNSYSRLDFFSLEYKKFSDEGNEAQIYQIRSLQATALNELVNIYKNNYYPMEWVTPIIVPRKNEINIGEKFIADIYLIGGSRVNKYLVIINNDTLHYPSDSICPVFEEIATSKGKKVINGSMQIFHAGLNKTFEYKLSAQYNVK